VTCTSTPLLYLKTASTSVVTPVEERGNVFFLCKESHECVAQYDRSARRLASARGVLQNKVFRPCPEDVIGVPATTRREHLHAVSSAFPFIIKCRDCAIIHASHSISSSASTQPYSSPPRPRGPDPARPCPTPSSATRQDPTQPHPDPPDPRRAHPNLRNPTRSHAITRHPTPPATSQSTPSYLRHNSAMGPGMPKDPHCMYKPCNELRENV